MLDTTTLELRGYTAMTERYLRLVERQSETTSASLYTSLARQIVTLDRKLRAMEDVAAEGLYARLTAD